MSTYCPQLADSVLSLTYTWPVAVIAITIIIAFFTYRWIMQSKAERKTRTLLLVLRVIGILLAGMFLCIPVVRSEEIRKSDRPIVILVDDSKSMSISDTVGNRKRGEAIIDALFSEVLGIVPELEKLAPVRTYRFSRNCEQVDSTRSAFSFSGNATNIAFALKKVAKEGEPRPGLVLLCTDGNETAAESVPGKSGAAAEAVTYPTPVHTIGVGAIKSGTGEFKDAAIVSISTEPEAILNSKIPVTVNLKQSGFAGKTGTLQLKLIDDVHGEKAFPLDADTVSVKFTLHCTRPGLNEYTAYLKPFDGEQIEENNAMKFAIRVTTEKLKVFYYEVTPRWEFKFSKRTLAQDEAISLFPFVKTSPEKLVVQGKNLDITSFPTDLASFKMFDCVILGDVGADEAGAKGAEAVAAYVEQGGGIVILGGSSMLTQNSIFSSSLSKILPVDAQGLKLVEGPFKLRLTQDGASSTMMAGISPLYLDTIYSGIVLKPSAQVLAVAEGGGSSFPLVITAKYGEGRVVMLLSDTFWKWCMKYADAGGQSSYNRLYQQIVRFCSNREAPDSRKGRAVIFTDKSSYRADEKVAIFVSGCDKNAKPVVKISHGGKESGTLTLSTGAESFEGYFEPSQDGIHQARLYLGGDEPVSTCEFFVTPPAGELDNPFQNQALLQLISAKTGGRYFDLSTVRQIPAAVKSSGYVNVNKNEYSYNDSVIAFLILLGVASTEWILRRIFNIV